MCSSDLSSSYGYVHSAISSEPQHFFSGSFMKREREGVSLSDALPRVRSPLGEGSSSQEGSWSETFMRFQEKEEDMGIPPSRQYQDLMSPIEDEAFPIIKEKAGGDSAVKIRGLLAFQEEGRRSSEAPKEFQEREELLIRSTRSIHEENSESSSHGYVHSAISPKLQGSVSNFFMKRKKEGVSLFDALPGQDLL